MRMPTPSDEVEAASRGALAELAAPLARLCVSHGLPFAVLEELLKRAYVDAARAVVSGSTEQRDISRVSAATGLNRREVTRLTQAIPAPATQRASPVSELFTRWVSDSRYRTKRGEPRVLDRQGPAPSFESLARSITQDVHPRTLLEELCRLGLAEHDGARDRVRLLQGAFVPRRDQARMFGFLGANVADHFSAAVANVLGQGTEHFEQAIFADDLSSESLATVRALVAAQWQQMLDGLVPELERLIAADREIGRDAGQRVRIGLYTYQEDMTGPETGKGK